MSSIHQATRTWSKAEERDDGRELMTAVQATIENALQGKFLPLTYIPVDSEDNTEAHT